MSPRRYTTHSTAIEKAWGGGTDEPFAIMAVRTANRWSREFVFPDSVFNAYVEGILGLPIEEAEERAPVGTAYAMGKGLPVRRREVVCREEGILSMIPPAHIMGYLEFESGVELQQFQDDGLAAVEQFVQGAIEERDVSILLARRWSGVVRAHKQSGSTEASVLESIAVALTQTELLDEVAIVANGNYPVSLACMRPSFLWTRRA